MTIRKLAGMLFIINGLQFLLGAGILLGLHINVFTGNEYLLDAAMIIVLLSSLLTILGLLSVTRYQLSLIHI